jgi:hypothetical protein
VVEIADIGNEKSLREWLEDKPPELAVLLAHRAAARVIPVYWAWAAGYSTKGGVTEIALWRKLLTSQLRSVYATREVSDAASNAAAANADAQFVAVRAAVFAAVAAAAAANGAATAAIAANAAAAAKDATAADIFEDVRRDAAAYLGTNMRAPSPLWEGGKAGVPPDIAVTWETTRAKLTARVEAGETGWQFWIDWYEAQLTGADQNWEMLKEIVLIPDADWQKGAAHVNGLIEEIVERYQGDASPTLSGHAETPGDADFDADYVPGQPLAQMLNRNAKTIRLQLDTLASLLRDEIDVLRGRNDLSDEERDEAQRRIEILNRVLGRVEAMAGEFSEGQASENALTVVEENLPALPEDAAELVEEGGDPVVSDLVISMGANIEHLTKRGTPGSLATGIAAFVHLWDGVKRWWNSKSGGPP